MASNRANPIFGCSLRRHAKRLGAISDSGLESIASNILEDEYEIIAERIRDMVDSIRLALSEGRKPPVVTEIFGEIDEDSIIAYALNVGGASYVAVPWAFILGIYGVLKKAFP